MPIKVKLGKTSLCACGFSLLHDEIKLGTVFTVHPETVNRFEPYYLQCVGCGLNIMGFGQIWADSVRDPTACPTPLPLELFDFSIAALVETTALAIGEERERREAAAREAADEQQKAA